MLDLFQHLLVKSVICRGLRGRFLDGERVKNRIFRSSLY